MHGQLAARLFRLNCTPVRVSSDRTISVTPLITSSIFTAANGTVLLSANAATFSHDAGDAAHVALDDRAKLLVKLRFVAVLLEQRGKGLSETNGFRSS